MEREKMGERVWERVGKGDSGREIVGEREGERKGRGARVGEIERENGRGRVKGRGGGRERG